MKLLGNEITISKAQPRSMNSVSEDRGWIRIFESFPGAFQQDVTLSVDTALSYSAVYACLTLIASDIAKLPVNMKKMSPEGIWIEAPELADLKKLLRKPNGYQNRIQFIQHWNLSKLSRGNTYVLIVRNGRGIPVKLYVLDPDRVTTLVSDTGEVFYRLSEDNVSGIEDSVTVPATEIIHDRMPALFHPLIGTSPIFACALAAAQGLAIQKNSANFFGNMSRPGGIITAPGQIPPDAAKEVKDTWASNYSGKNAGRVAVLGDGMKYEQVTIDANDAQLIDQLKWTSSDVCSCFHVPPYKVGFGPIPTYANAEILNQIYYEDCLQILIESQEMALDDSFGFTAGDRGFEFDIDNLLRMDTAARYATYKEAIGAGWLAPNEARKKEDFGPVAGGGTPYMQQQNWSLEQLAKRDINEKKALPAPQNGANNPENPEDEEETPPPGDQELASGTFFAAVMKSLKEEATA